MNNKMAVVVHPEDVTTDDFKHIYEKNGKYRFFVDRVVRDPYLYNPQAMKRLIRNSERFVAVGHGSERGLFGLGQLKQQYQDGFAIDGLYVPELLKKDDNVLIWCYASVFAQTHGICGFFTGMFISDQFEASLCGISTEWGQVEASNKLFAEIIGDALHTGLDTKEFYDFVMDGYKSEDPIVQYNRARFEYRLKVGES